MRKTSTIKEPETQLECWTHVVNNGILIQDDMKIKFIHGRLCAIIDNKWTPCPIIFEHPNMFRYYYDKANICAFHVNHERVV